MKKLLVFIAVLAIAIPSLAATLRVPSQYPTIQAGINAAVNGDTVLVANGTYTGAGNKNLDFLGKAIVVKSENGPENCIIDCQGSGRGFTCTSGEDSTSILAGFKIINALVPLHSNGGGIFLQNSNLTISHCIFYNNSATNGGGIFIQYSNPIIEYCLFYGNSAAGNGNGSNGGGLAVLESNPKILNCTICDNFAEGYGGGIYTYIDSSIITNCIFSGDSGNYNGGGIHCGTRSNPFITYCDFYDNYRGNYTGNVPVNLGLIVIINSNGDSCDIYRNIYINPLFVNANVGDFNLQQSSPCVNTGDPHSPRDPDGTRADMGAYYFDHSLSGITPTVTLTPINPPIRINPSGGWMRFNVTLEDTTGHAGIFDCWTSIYLPGYGGATIKLFRNVSLPTYPYNVVLRQGVPGLAPAGIYTYFACVGEYPWQIVNSDSFQFEKLGADGGGWLGSSSDWPCEGDFFDDELMSEIHHSSFIIHPCVPNPFNPSTVLIFELRDASLVKLVVYDIAGREAAVLVDGMKPTGAHEVVWNASAMPSGVYFVRLEAGDFVQTRKMLLIK